MKPMLSVMTAEDLLERRGELTSAKILAATKLILEQVENGGEQELHRLGRKLDGLGENDSLVIERTELERSLLSLPLDRRELLERCAERVSRFAQAQLDSVSEFSLAIPGGRTGQNIDPLARVGCYVPAGNHPLPSSLLMSVCTAKVAGVEEIWVASPRPGPLIKAVAALAGADAVIPLGGAQAIAAMGLGIGPIPACDLVAGPGNAWVTAAKRLLAGRVNIDMLAGPSELLIIADAAADPRWIAADLIAQAEHDQLARPMLLCVYPGLIDRVEAQLREQVAELEAKPGAFPRLAQCVAVVVDDLDRAAELANSLAPEHVQVMLAKPEQFHPKLRNYGSLFIGAASAVVLGDYGAGPNHILPTEGVARQRGGLSVLDFVRIRTWIEIQDPQLAKPLIRDAVELATLEGLPGHALAAAIRTELPFGASPQPQNLDNHNL